MNIDDFLQENGFDKNEAENDSGSGSDGASSPRSSNDMDIKGIYNRFSLILQVLHFCSGLQLQ